MKKKILFIIMFCMISFMSFIYPVFAVEQKNRSGGVISAASARLYCNDF